MTDADDLADATPGGGEPYRPIDCSVHDRLEALATLGVPCRIRYRGPDDEEHELVDRIVDVFARGGEEFLDTAGGVRIRLDRLTQVERAEA